MIILLFFLIFGKIFFENKNVLSPVRSSTKFTNFFINYSTFLSFLHSLEDKEKTPYEISSYPLATRKVFTVMMFFDIMIMNNFFKNKYPCIVIYIPKVVKTRFCIYIFIKQTIKFPVLFWSTLSFMFRSDILLKNRIKDFPHLKFLLWFRFSRMAACRCLHNQLSREENMFTTGKRSLIRFEILPEVAKELFWRRSLFGLLWNTASTFVLLVSVSVEFPGIRNVVWDLEGVNKK